jgi:hypothetical protein
MTIVAQKIVLKEDKIMEKWSTLIQNAQGRSSEVIEKTARVLEESGVPGVKAEMARVFPKVAPSFLDSAFLKKLEKQGKDYLMITNENIRSLRLLVGAQDYGNNLFVSWYLICEPGVLSKFFNALSGKKPDEVIKWSPVITNVFMEEELTAYITLIHHCVLGAVESLMSGAGQDFSKIDRRTKGFMGIS